MKVYRGTITRNQSRKGSASAAAANGRFMSFVTIVSIVFTVIAIVGGFFLYYMSLVQQMRITDRHIQTTKQQIAETHRSLQVLTDEYARLTRYEYVCAKIRQFRLPLALAHHSQVKMKNMEILTPLQASRETYPRRNPVAVAGNLRNLHTYPARY